MNKKGYLILIIVVLVAVGSFVLFKNRSDSFDDPLSKEPPKIDLNDLGNINLPPSNYIPEKIAEPAPPPEGYIKYVNKKYSFSFYHSPEGKITEHDQGQGSMIITLENEQKQRGMQIFIVPYWEKTISDARFKADVPSGVRENVEKTYVDGVEAVTFNSVDESLGSTREVWIIRGGYLYEITTFQGVGIWFTPIMQTWKFF